jgi:hemolysin III
VVELDSSTTLERPRLRGVFHLWAFVVFAALGVVLVATAPGSLERLAGAVFGAALVLTFGVSALYHRVTWRPAARRLMRRLDHAAIFLLIAGTYTPYGLLVLSGAWQFSVLGIVWIGAALAITQRLIWVDAPKWVAALAGISLGWVGVVVFPQILAGTGSAGTALVVAGGLLYTVGAVVYVVQRPDPVPAVFGYHEVFHLLTIAAAACHFAAIAFFVLPRG